MSSTDPAPNPVEVDCRGLLCPLPVRLSENALARLPVGSRIEVVCTDPAAELDLAAFCARAGHEISKSGEMIDEQRFTILKRR
jgi:tRNA 2-thiouridine synthesizing protein A